MAWAHSEAVQGKNRLQDAAQVRHGTTPILTDNGVAGPLFPVPVKMLLRGSAHTGDWSLR